MFYCNNYDKSFTRRDNLIRHHRDFHNDEASFKSLLYSLGNSKDMPRAHSSKDMSDEEPDNQSDTEEEMDDDSIASTSSSDEDGIEDELNYEDTSTPSLYPLRNAWAMIGEDADSFYDSDIVGAYIDQVRVGRQLKNDPVHKKVMETMQSLQRRDSNMDFEESLVKAAYRRKHIIEQATIDAKQDEEQGFEMSGKKSKWSV